MTRGSASALTSRRATRNQTPGHRGTAGVQARRRFVAAAVLSAVLFTVGVVLPATDAIEHFLPQGPPHPAGPHFEDSRSTAHSDHCILGRGLFAPRLLASGEEAPGLPVALARCGIASLQDRVPSRIRLLPLTRAPPA